MSDVDVNGPIDFVLIEFDADKMTGEAAAALLDLVERGIVRLFDLLIIRKDADGTATAIDVSDLQEFAPLLGAQSGLLGDEDIAEAAAVLEPGKIAALIVYENTWARAFVAAARRAGGEMIASARLPAQDIIDALDALDAMGA